MPSIKKRKRKRKEAKQRRKIFAQNFYDAPKREMPQKESGGGGRDRVGGVCRSSVLLPFASCPLKWCKIYEARPLSAPILLNFIPFAKSEVPKVVIVVVVLVVVIVDGVAVVVVPFVAVVVAVAVL